MLLLLLLFFFLVLLIIVAVVVVVAVFRVSSLDGAPSPPLRLQLSANPAASQPPPAAQDERHPHTTAPTPPPQMCCSRDVSQALVRRPMSEPPRKVRRTTTTSSTTPEASEYRRAREIFLQRCRWRRSWLASMESEAAARDASHGASSENVSAVENEEDYYDGLCREAAAMARFDAVMWRWMFYADPEVDIDRWHWSFFHPHPRSRRTAAPSCSR